MASRSPAVAWFVALRPRQSLKNAFVFAALVFSAAFHDPVMVARTCVAFVAMCLISSATYLVNDAIDVERDRVHPRKRFRPIAAGEVTTSTAFASAVALGVIGLAAMASLNLPTLELTLAYVGLQVAYNWRLKREPIADVFTIATGFVLRTVVGATAISVPISGWLLYGAGSLALMLGFAKRRSEFLAQDVDATATRQSLAFYNRASLDALVAMFGVAAALTYMIYALQSKTAAKYPFVVATTPFVVYGIARYVLLALGDDEGEEPAELMTRDPHLIAAMVGFAITALLALNGLDLRFIER